MALIPRVNAAEKWLIENTLRKRYGEKVDDKTSLRMPKFACDALTGNSPPTR